MSFWKLGECEKMRSSQENVILESGLGEKWSLFIYLSLSHSLSMYVCVCVHAPMRLGKVVLHLSVNTEPTHLVHTNDGPKHTMRKKTFKV